MLAGDIIIIGGGEHARVVIEAARSDPRGWRVIGFVDPESCDETCDRLGVRRLGGDEALRAYPDAASILGFGSIVDTIARTSAHERLAPLVARWATVVHRDASISPTAVLGEGTVVMARAVIQSGATVGHHAIINTAAVIEHDVWLGEHVQVAPGAVIGGGTSIGRAAYIGLGASVRDHIHIGEGAVIAMGATVVRNVAAGAVVMGGPVR
jgi:acetyltransferase EpsM